MSQVVPLIIYRASAPNPSDDISIGVEVDSRCHVGKYTYVCTDNSLGSAVWELTINPLNDVLSVGNDAGTQQIKNIGDATEEKDAMSYGQFLRGLAGLTSYFFSSTNSDIATYESMPDLANYTSAAEANNGGVVVSTTPTSLGKFATNSDFPNVTKIPIGLFSAHVEVQKGAGSNNYSTFFKLYKRNLAGTETLLVTSDYSSEVSANTRQQVTVSAYIVDPITLLATDRLVIEWYSVMNSSTATITMYYDGTTNARFSMPVVASSTSLTQASQAQVEASFDNTTQTTPTTLEQNSTLTPFNTWWLIQKIKTWVTNGFTAKNSAITGATKTKITYDSKGLVTSGADATQDDIGDGTTYKQYSQTEKTKLAAISGSNTGDETTSSIQTKRPLKTINTQSLEGTGDLTVTGFTAASVAEINTGSEPAKGATPLNLETSKYMTQYGQKTFAAASLSGGAYTVTLSPAITSYIDGQELKVRFTNAPTGSSTLNFNGVGAKKLYLDSTTQVGSGSFPAGYEAIVRYVASLDTGAGGWLLTQFSWWSWIKTQAQTFAAQITFSVALRINTSNGTSAILGSAGNGVLAFTDNSSAVNRIELVNSTTGNGTTVRASGSDSNVALIVASKGTGALSLRIGSTERLGIAASGAITISQLAGGSMDRIVTKDSAGLLKDSGLEISDMQITDSTTITNLETSGNWTGVNYTGTAIAQKTGMFHYSSTYFYFMISSSTPIRTTRS